MLSTDHIEKTLREAKLTVNQNRVDVYTAFLKQRKAVAPKTILENLREKRPFDKVTLYRILERFVESGLIRPIATANRSATLYEAVGTRKGSNHPHRICRTCGNVECIRDKELLALIDSIEHLCKRTGESVDVKIDGLCHSCHSRRPS